MAFVKLYLVTLSIFLAIDMTWLLVLAQGFYSKHIGHLMAEQPDLLAAAAFYLLNTAGILIFAIAPALRKKSLRSAALLGAGFGFFTYATYDLTNRATLRDWPLIVVFADLAWGVLVTGTTATASTWIGSKFVKKAIEP